jgi:hypothetical protein
MKPLYLDLEKTKQILKALDEAYLGVDDLDKVIKMAQNGDAENLDKILDKAVAIPRAEKIKKIEKIIEKLPLINIAILLFVKIEEGNMIQFMQDNNERAKNAHDLINAANNIKGGEIH